MVYIELATGDDIKIIGRYSCPLVGTGPRNIACMWFGEICFCMLSKCKVEFSPNKHKHYYRAFKVEWYQNSQSPS